MDENDSTPASVSERPTTGESEQAEGEAANQVPNSATEDHGDHGATTLEPQQQGSEEDCHTGDDNTRPKDNICAVLPNQRDSESASTVPRFCGLCDDHEVLADGHCNECADDLCSGCIHRHRRMRTVADHTIVIFSQQHQLLESSDGGERAALDSSHRRPFSPSISETEVVDRCHKHKTEDLRFFCKTCQLPVCRDCILTTHKQHLTDDITEASASALRDLSAMMSQLQEKKLLMESRLRSFHAYKSSFEESAQQVTEIVKTFYTEITEAVEASFKELTSDLQQCQETEAARIQNQEQNFHKSLQGVSRLLGQQTPIFNSPLAVLRQRDVVADALTSIDHNLDKLQVNSGEFLVSRNPRLTKIPANILGKVAFTVIRSSAGPDNLKTDSPQPQASISEISLRRELAFNIWEMNCAKSSVKTIVEGSHGTVWVATPRSIIKIGSSVTKDSAHIPDDIANISAAPDGKLLVSFGQGGAVKLYSNGSWSRGFTTMARSITSMASRELRGRSQVYVAETPQDDFPSRILVYTAEGKISYQQQLPLGILNTNNDHDGQTSASERSRQEGSASSTGGPRLKISAMAVGADGSLCLGDTAGGRVVMLDAEGNMTGEYRGPDGHSGCVPRSVCLASHGQVVVADSAQSSVELVSAEGHLLATLLVREHFQDSGVPTAVATDSKGRLWVGTSLGHVSAYSFLQRNP